MRLEADLVVDELRHLAPEVRVAGGSFAHWLPHPREVPRSDRERVLLTAQKQATGQCLTELVASAGFPAVEPARLASGAREWPAGCTGSVSHKGTTVAAAIASTDQMTSIGIDIERLDAEHVPVLRGLDLAEQPSSVANAEGRVILLSVKEAAYKALDPIVGRALGLSDIAVSWVVDSPAGCRGVARTYGVTLDVRCSTAVPRWIASVALWPIARHGHDGLSIGQIS